MHVREIGRGVDKTIPLLSICCAKCKFWTVITELFEAMPCITKRFVLAGKYRSKPLKLGGMKRKKAQIFASLDSPWNKY